MSVELVTKHHLVFLCRKGGYTGSTESTLVKMKSHVVTKLFCCSSLNPDEEEEERKASYESYRILVENECAGCKDFLAFIEL